MDDGIVRAINKIRKSGKKQKKGGFPCIQNITNNYLGCAAMAKIQREDHQTVGLIIWRDVCPATKKYCWTGYKWFKKY